MKHFVKAQQLEDDERYLMSYAKESEARTAFNALVRFRRSGKMGAPGDYDITRIDPKGEGVGTFDNISISRPQYNTGGRWQVVLQRIPKGRLKALSKFKQPLEDMLGDDKPRDIFGKTS